MKQFLQLIRPFREMRKIVVLCLVMVMAMGAAWGQTEEVYSICRFGSAYNPSNSSYTSSFTVTNSSFTWTVTNANNNNNGWTNSDGYGQIKFGRKNTASLGKITTDAAYSEAITKVELTIDNITAAKINSIKLYSGTSASSITTLEGEFAKSTGTQTVVIANPSADKFYDIQFDCASGSSNGLVTVSKVEYYYNVGGAASPSITANYVNIAYDAISGEIAYTLNNPATNGILSVSENVDWISNAVLNETEGKVNFTTTTNEENTAREGVITITYTYGDNETVTKDVTVTQAAAPVIYDNIEDLFNAATSTATDVTVSFESWFVTGVSTTGKNVFVTDGTNGFVIFDNAGNLGDTYHVDDLIDGTTTASLVLYTGFAELKNVDATNLTMTSYEAPAFADVAMDDLSGINTGALVHYDNLTCSVSDNKYYLSDGTTSLQVYNALYAFDALVDGKTYNITGVYQQYNSTKEILPRSAADIEEVVSADPIVTVTPATINVPFEGADGTLAITYENITEIISFDYNFCDAEGNDLQEDPDWITAEIQEEDDTYSLYYLIDANDGAARTAYIKVYTLDDELEVVSAIVNVNQAQYVVDYATLPFEYDGNGTGNLPNGFTVSGLGTYGSSPAMKFDGTGDYAILKFNERPGTLTFDIKGNSFSGGTFKVQASEDGTTYTDLETYTDSNFGNTLYEEEFTNLGESVRYIKWIYTNKSSGNVALGNIALAEYVAPQPAITLNSYSIEATAAETEGTLTVTYTEIETSAGVEIYWYEADGTTEATYNHDWIQTEINSENNVYYLIGANEGAARTAYFKVYGVDADLNDVYSDLVTVTQAAVPQQYTLTVSELNANISAIYVFDADNLNNPLIADGLAGTVQVVEGTDIVVSPDVEDGYVLASLIVNNEDVSSQLDESGAYTFTMPAGNVTISATALVAPATEDYELFSGDLVEGDYVIYYNGYAMKNLVTNGRLDYVTINPDNNVISTSDASIIWHIAQSGDYWTIYNDEAQAYAASTGAKNKAQMLADGTDDKALWLVEVTDDDKYEFENKANSAANVNNLLRNNGTNGWACYASATGGSLSLYKKVVPLQYRISFVTNSAEIDELVANSNSNVSLPDASIDVTGWVFAGWSQSFVLETTTEPVLVANPYTVTDNVVLYAVYKKEQSSSFTYNSHPSDVQIVLDENNPSYTIDFETATAQTYYTEETPAGWSLIWIEAPRRPNRRSQIVYVPIYAHGDYFLRMDSLNILAMPAVNVPVNTLQMELYVRQPYVCHQLEVGVLEATAGGGYEFKRVATINNNTSALERRVVDFSGYEGEGRRIAFRNVYNAEDYGLKSFNYIDDITLSIGGDDGTCGITDIEYKVDFELTDYEGGSGRTGRTLDCWTLVQHDVVMTSEYEPQIYNSSNYSHSGSYSLLMDGRCLYAMPEFKVDDMTLAGVEMELYVRQPYTQSALQVGVMSDVNDPNTFVSLETISNNGMSGQKRHVISFVNSQNAQNIEDWSEYKYIAFRNVYNGSWDRSPQYIDDIKLDVLDADGCAITSLPYEEDFEGATTSTDQRTGVEMPCWTLSEKYYTISDYYGPQVFYAASYAHSGSYTFLMDGRCLYAMPEFNVQGKTLADVELEFYVRQPYAESMMEVGVMSDVNNPSTFVPLETISNNGMSGQQSHVISFVNSQNAQSIEDWSEYKYIAFRNVYNGSWDRSTQYLDDITLSVPEAKIAEVSSENEIDAMGVERYLEDIKVYPNPTRGNLYIDAMDVQKVECYNQMGQLVGVYDNANELNIGDLSNGIYMLRITVPQGVTMRKVVKK